MLRKVGLSLLILVLCAFASAWAESDPGRISGENVTAADIDTVCNCPSQGDIAPPSTNGDGIINVLDVVHIIDCVFKDCLEMASDPECPTVRGDVTAIEGCYDGIFNVLDVVYLIDHVFRSGPPPCDPCIQ